MTENIKNQIRQIFVSRGATDGLEEVWAKARPVFKDYGVNVNEGAACLRELFEEEQNQIKTWCGRLRKNLGPVPIERAEPLFKDSPLGRWAGAVEVFRQTWPDYTNGNSLPLAKQRAAQRSRHPIADKFPEFDPEISALANICEELQALRGDRDFWFTIDDMAKTIDPQDPDKSREKARRIRNLLELGFLTVTQPGRGKKPTLYRLAAPRDETQTRTQIHPARD